MAKKKRTTNAAAEPAVPGPVTDEAEPGAETNPSGVPGRRLSLIPHSVDPRLVFRFEFGPAILAQVLEQLEQLPIIPLDSPKARAAAFPGFYQLFRREENGYVSKYLGRTFRPVGARLKEHQTKLRGRIPLDEMGCKFVYVEDLSLVGLSEEALLEYFHPRGLDEWGQQGFGSKVTGHGRAAQTSLWYDLYPPDLSWPVSVHGGETTIYSFVRAVASSSPITLSIPNKFKPRIKAAFPAPVKIDDGTKPFADWISTLEEILRPGWRIDRHPTAWYVVPINGGT